MTKYKDDDWNYWYYDWDWIDYYYNDGYGKFSYIIRIPVADPGFPRGGGTNSPGGHQHTILPKFPKSCMKLKEFGPLGGCASLMPPPFRSTTVFYNILQ